MRPNWDATGKHFRGPTRQFFYPGLEGLPLSPGKRITFDTVRTEQKDLLEFLQNLGMIVGLFCECGAELIMDATFEDEALTCQIAREYFCPSCDRLWILAGKGA